MRRVQVSLMFTEVAALAPRLQPSCALNCWRGCELSEPIQVRSFIHFLYLNIRSVKFSVCIDFYFSLPVFCVGSPPQWDTSSRALRSDCHSGRSIRAVMWDGMRQDCSALSPSIRIYFTKWIFSSPPSLPPSSHWVPLSPSYSSSEGLRIINASV